MTTNGTKLTDAEISVKIETLRKKARILIIPGLVLFIICVVIAIILLIVTDAQSLEVDYSNLQPEAIACFIAVGFGVIGTVLLMVGARYKRKLKQVVSDHLVHGVLEEFFTLNTYESKMHISENDIRSAGMVGGWEKVRGSDYVVGSYKTLGIQFSDVELYRVERRTDSDGDTHYSEETVFKGPWLICDFGIELPAKLIIRENRTTLTGGYKKDKNSLETENESFNTRYQIHTGDAHTAFYILTPHFMERIQEINNRSGGRLYICFEGKRVHIAVYNNHDSFEVGSKASEFQNLETLREKFRMEIRYLTDIIDELMQNDKLFKGENK